MAIEKVVNITVKENGMNEVNSKVKRLENSLESLENQQESLTNSMHNSSQSVLDNGGAMGLLNDLTGGLAMTVKDAVEATDLFTKSEKAKTIATTISTAVVGTSTGALKALRIALAATGVGLLVVGLGLLIANFDKVTKFVQSGIDKFKGLGDTTKNVISVLFPLIGVIRLVTLALEEMGVIESDAVKNLRIQAEERERIRKKELANLVASKQKVSDAYDFEIEKLKASGKDTERTEALKRNAILKTLQAQNDLDRARIASGNASQDEIKAWNERQKEISKIVKDTEIAQLESEKRKADKQKEINDKSRDNRKKLFDEAKKINEEELANNLKNSRTLIEQENADFKKKYDILKAQKISTEALEIGHLNRINDINLEIQAKVYETNAKIAEEKKLKDEERYKKEDEQFLRLQELTLKTAEFEKLSLTQKYEAEYLAAEGNAELQLALKEKLAKDISAIDKKELEDKLAKEQALKDAKIAFANQTLQLISAIAGEGSELAKGVAVAQATISGIEGVQNAYTTAQKSPITALFPAYPLVQAGIAGAFSALQIKKILSTPKSGGTGASSSSVGGGGGASAPSFNVVQGTGTNQIAQSLATEKKPLKAYVVASEMSTQQSLDRNIQKGASL